MYFEFKNNLQGLYENYKLRHDAEDNLECFLNDSIGFTTYDGELDELFGKQLYEIMQVIHKKTNFEYIKNEENYIKYIVMANQLDRYKLIDWGTSIRGAWLTESGEKLYEFLNATFKGVK